MFSSDYFSANRNLRRKEKDGFTNPWCCHSERSEESKIVVCKPVFDYEPLLMMAAAMAVAAPMTDTNKATPAPIIV